MKGNRDVFPEIDRTLPHTGVGFRSALAALALCSPAIAASEGDLPDKSRYHLFNPTPKAFLRELSADRPDKTESPYTVDAGHFQVETDFLNLTSDRHNSERDHTRTLAWEIFPSTLKAGVLNNLDIQVAIGPHGSEQVEDKTLATRDGKSGFGDVTPRLKWNVVGNDGGPFALALLPFLKIPTGEDGLGNNSVEAGLKMPYAIEAGEWEVSLQHEIDWSRNKANAEYHPEFVNSISIGHPVAGKLSYFIEFYSSVSADHGAAWIGTFDTWVTYPINENLRLDAGVYIGLTRAADDLHPFIGITWRY